MKFEFYVLNYDHNKNKVVHYNIFDNIKVQEATERAIKKYLRSPKKYKYSLSKIDDCDDESSYGFSGLCREINSIIRWQEWGRYEYEIGVSSAFDNSKLEKWDCYMQARPNIPMIARECIYQYKQQAKNARGNTYD